jgi:hypothetical protein
MIKRIFAFQRLLLNSMPRLDKGSDIRTFIILFTLIYIAIIPLFGMASFNIILPVASVYLVYRILNGDRKVFQLIPVSNSYVAENVFLLSIILTVFCYLVVWLLAWAGIGLIIVIVLIISSLSGKNPSSGGSSISSSSDSIIASSSEWKNVLFSLMVFLIIIFVVTAFSLAKNKKVRLIGIALFSVGAYAFLWLLKLSIPVENDSGMGTLTLNCDIMPLFYTTAYAETILLWLGIACLLIIPLSVIFGLKCYRQPPVSRYIKL